MEFVDDLSERSGQAKAPCDVVIPKDGEHGMVETAADEGVPEAHCGGEEHDRDRMDRREIDGDGILRVEGKDLVEFLNLGPQMGEGEPDTTRVLV